VFSSTPVQITFARPDASSDSNPQQRLPLRDIIGIAVGGGVLVIITLATFFICYRKRREAKLLDKLRSPLDSRFGASNITSPNNSAYGNPYANPPITGIQHFTLGDLSAKERHVLGIEVPIALQMPPTREQISKRHQENASANGQLPPYSPPSIPTHKAYTPPFTSRESDSPTTTITSEYQISPYTSPYTSPYPSPPAISPPPAQASQQAHPSPPIQRTPTSTRTQFNHPRTSPAIPPTSSPPIQRTPTSIRTQFTHPRTSPATPPASSDFVKTHISTTSRSDSEKSGVSRLTSMLGIGNANASNDKAPLRISRPIVGPDHRFDFELAEQESRQNQQQGVRRRMPESTPDSAQSEEQWPGAY
jgi:hypothetical protein